MLTCPGPYLTLECGLRPLSETSLGTCAVILVRIHTYIYICIHIYIYIYAYLYTHAYIHMCSNIQGQINMQVSNLQHLLSIYPAIYLATCLSLFIYRFICLCMYLYIYMKRVMCVHIPYMYHMYMHTVVYARTYIYIYVCMYVCIYIEICTCLYRAPEPPKQGPRSYLCAARQGRRPSGTGGGRPGPALQDAAEGRPKREPPTPLPATCKSGSYQYLHRHVICIICMYSCMQQVLVFMSVYMHADIAIARCCSIWWLKKPWVAK